jgi:hypothetical protein
MTTITLCRLFRSGVYHGFACCLSALPLIAGWGSTAEGSTVHEGTAITVQTESNGHKFKFVVPSSGPLSISELAPIGSAPILNDELVATKTPAELYLSVAGPGATVPDALVNAQNRSNAPATAAAASPVLAPVSRQSATGSGPSFYDSGQQSWFKSNFCQSGWECVQGWAYADSSGGYVRGRGYSTYAMNGSEASCARTFNEDYWNGSSWANLQSGSIPPGYYNSEWAGNTGAPTVTDGNWYFKSELNDCGGTATQVSLSDFTYPWVRPSVSFAMSGSGPISYCPPPGAGSCGLLGGDAQVDSGSINVSLNGNWSTSPGELEITDSGSVGTDSFHTNISCPIPGLTLTWYCQPGQNLFTDPTCTLSGGSGTSSSLAANWSSVLAAWQSSSTVNCNVSSELE